MEIIFSAIGKPIGKQRPRMTRRGRKTITYTPQETVNYERLIREAFLLSALKEELPMTGLLVVDVVALFPRTKALSFQYKNGSYKHSTERIPHSVKPDADNVLKCVLDGIGDYIEGGDSRVVSARITKFYSRIDENEGTIVRIRKIEPNQLSVALDVDWADGEIE